jgi:hypothetical protein
MYATVDDSGTEGTITLSKTVSGAPYAIAQHEGARIHQVATRRQAVFLTYKLKQYIAPGTEINITLKPLKFLTRVWNSAENRNKLRERFKEGIFAGIKKAGL